MTYKVGQVLYAVLNKQTAVYPVQVIEEITKKTLSGTVVDYVVRGGGAESKSLKLKEVEGEIFDSAEKARDALIERVVSQINSRVESAILKAREWYPDAFNGESPRRLPVPKQSFIDEASQLEEAAVDLGNGIVGKIKLPETFG